MNPPSVFLVAGEVSGDMHAAALVRAVLARRPEVRFFGVGGDELRRAGMEVLQDNREMAVLGLTEVLKKYFFFRRVFDAMVALAEERRPDAVLLVDYPGFNLRFAKRIHRRGLKVIYFICPQVWAWDRGRIPMMAKIVDRLIAIFPFEPAVFANTGLKVDFVGHPLVDKAREALAEPLQPLAWNGVPRVALLPGSREQELIRIMPVMWRAAGLVAKRHPEAGFIVAAPSEELAARVRDLIRTIPGGPPKAEVVAGYTRQALRQATAAFVASGTAT
ncbi:MAG: lipid-A-disaccharide synthase, partial [Lentisphaerae bacterium]|nr:lipid-A-disaccharide synthase [Lentisphaerota bacterium]